MRVDLRRLTALAALAAAVVFPGSSDHHPRPSGPASPGPSVDDTLLPKPGGADVADFRAVQQKPAASAAIRRLPHVRLTTLTVAGIPPVPLTAYRNAARALAASDPGCHLPWWLVAGIGLVESGHARSGGSGHAGWNGVAHPPIYGPVLNGSHSFKRIPDTDGGRLDGDPRWDRAVGPMQFLPSTWRTGDRRGTSTGRPTRRTSSRPRRRPRVTSAPAGRTCHSRTRWRWRSTATTTRSTTSGWCCRSAPAMPGCRRTGSASTCCPRMAPAANTTRVVVIAIGTADITVRPVAPSGRRPARRALRRPRAHRRHRRRAPALGRCPTRCRP
jgi:hypothetical protein